MNGATKDRGGVRHIPFNRDERSGEGLPPEEIRSLTANVESTIPYALLQNSYCALRDLHRAKTDCIQ